MKRQYPKTYRPYLYARRAPARGTVDGIPCIKFGWKDVVFSHDLEFTDIAGRIPAGQKQPDRRNKYQTLNCAKYQLIWRPDK